MSQSIKSRIIKTAPVKWRELLFLQADTFKELPQAAKARLKLSVINNDFSQPFYVWEDTNLFCLDGKHRVDVLKEIAAGDIEDIRHLLPDGFVLPAVPDELPATFMYCENKQEAAALVLQYSSVYAKITEAGLLDFVESFDLDWDNLQGQLDLPNFDSIDMAGLMKDTEALEKEMAGKSLQDRFIVPPFSVLDSRQGYWQDRKKQWHALGFDSQETREDIEIISKTGQAPAVYALRNKMRAALGREPEWDEILAHAKEKGMHLFGGASIFDPVLCEIIYTWFCPTGGVVLDPFAGGSVRGIVAAKLGLQYHGIDLRADQVAANQRQAADMGVAVDWYAGDSLDINRILPKDFEADYFFSCPPYHDLEKYSDDAADLSNMNYEDFVAAYRRIIQLSLERLKPNRFACFVVGEIRGKDGFCKGFVKDTIEAFEDAGAKLYNEIILLNVAGSVPIRVGKQFTNSRKVGKVHQNVLVFFKGDPQKIKVDFPEINLPEDLFETNDHPNIALH